MIDRDKFIEYLKMLDKAYSPKMTFTKELVDMWYEMFADCDEEGLKMAVINCIKTSEFPPNIATLMRYYRELDDNRKEMFALITSNYTTLRSMWREQYDKETFKAIVEYVFRFPKEQRKVQTVELTHHAISFYNDCRNVGRLDIPTIKEYVEGKR